MAPGVKREVSAPRYSDGAAHFDMGEHTLRVPMSHHAHNRSRLVQRLAELRQTEVLKEKSVVFLQGGDELHRDATDCSWVFRQESFFHWLFGVLEPGWYGVIESDSGKTTLFCPQLPEVYAVVMGRIIPPHDFKTRYAVDSVHYVDELPKVLAEIKPTVLLTLVGENSDSGLTTRPAHFEGIDKFAVNSNILHTELSELRVTKSQAEIEIMKYAIETSSAAHCAVMKHIRPGMREYQLESVFQHHSYYQGGCRHQGYTNICGGGVSSAVLHYGHAGAPNDCVIRDGDICLFDMGAEYYCYSADITCSFPANGKFTEDQKFIYNAVLAANLAVFNAVKPGVKWDDMHALSYRVMLQKLKEGGLLQGDVDAMVEADLGAVFQPHGLGHLLGMDVHDSGGYLPHCPPRPTKEGFKKLRMARPLLENMFLTIEPGCYFIDCLLDKALASPTQQQFLVPEVLERFRGFGGVRIEDDVLITKDGAVNLTKVPRTVEEIEALMAEGRKETVVFPQQLGTHPSQK
ncbi:Aminopeptidase P N-terminal [Trinorchestia longiramus]|nr:Aminopeptidase P N-terminal [Trinorchestia longiramus]